MTNKTISSVRIIFASFALTLAAYAGLDAALAPAKGTIGLSGCGDAANPCQLAPLTVTARNSASHLVHVQAEAAESAVLAES
jgi:hypothetical protein